LIPNMPSYGGFLKYGYPNKALFFFPWSRTSFGWFWGNPIFNGNFRNLNWRYQILGGKMGYHLMGLFNILYPLII
jgi:hypothetical protein